MTDEVKVNVTIEGAGLKFAGEVTFQRAIEMLRIAALTDEQFQQPIGAASISVSQSPKQKVSLREALAAASPKTSPATIAVIAAWVMDDDGLESISREDVSSRYQDARLPLPGNFPRDFSSAVAKGYLAPQKGDRSKFYVTQTGRSLLDGSEK